MTAGGSRTVHIHTHNTQNDTKQTIHRITQKCFWKSAGSAPSLRIIPWHMPKTEEEARKNINEFYKHGSVHRESNLITVQQDATY